MAGNHYGGVGGVSRPLCRLSFNALTFLWSARQLLSQSRTVNRILEIETGGAVRDALLELVSCFGVT